MTDHELIARSLSADDRAAFGELVKLHQSAVRHFLRQLANGNAALADDLAQETFVQAWRSLARFQGSSLFRTWLLGIAHNQWRNAWRRDRVAADTAARSATSPPVSRDAARHSDLHRDLADALEQLDAEERLALHLGFQQGLTHSEIAALLDWPIGTVKTHLARGKEKLRSLLAAWNPQS